MKTRFNTRIRSLCVAAAVTVTALTGNALGALDVKAGMINPWFQVQENGTLVDVACTGVDLSDYPAVYTLGGKTFAEEIDEADVMYDAATDCSYYQGSNYRYIRRNDTRDGQYGELFAMPGTIAGYPIAAIQSSSILPNDYSGAAFLILPNTLTRLDGACFGESATLIPASVQEINVKIVDSDSMLRSEFSRNEQHMFYVYADSYAENWAKSNALTYTVVSTETLEEAVAQQLYSIWLENGWLDDDGQAKARIYQRAGKALLAEGLITTSQYATSPVTSSEQTTTTSTATTTTTPSITTTQPITTTSVTSSISWRDTTIYADQVYAAPGQQEVALSIRIANNPGFMGCNIRLDLDPALNVVTLSDGSPKHSMVNAESALSAIAYKSQYDAIVFNMASSFPISDDAAILTVYFNISDDAMARDKYIIEVTVNQLSSKTGQSIQYETANGAIIISDHTATTDTTTTTTTSSTTTTVSTTGSTPSTTTTTTSTSSTTPATTTVSTTESTPSSTTTTTTHTVAFGDISADGVVDANDANLVLMHYVQSLTDTETPLLTPSQQMYADVTGDGFIKANDATCILQYYVITLTDAKPSWYEITGNENAPR